MHDDSSPAPGGPAFAVLALLCLAVFLPSVASASFLNFDDPRLFGPHGEIAQRGLLGALDPTATIADAYLPVAHVSLWLDTVLAGDRPFWPHLHSLLLHVVVAFAIARLAFRLGWSSRAATAAAAVFAVHPALCESVLWVASRKDLLSGLFAVLALSTLARHVRGGLGTRTAVVRLAAFTLLAVYAKGTAIVLPLLAVPVIWCAGGSSAFGRRALPALAAVLVPSVLAALHHASIAASVGTMAATAELGERLAQVPGAFLHYLSASVWPVGLNILYPEVQSLEAFRHALLPGLAALVGYVGAIAVCARRAPRVAVGLAIWLLALTPFNTAIPATAIAAADRYLYLAIPGLALALAAIPRFGLALAVAAALALGVGARFRANDFESSQAVWRASLEVDPDNAAARVDLALALLEPDPLAASLIGVKSYAVDAVAEAEELLEQALDSARYPIHRVRAASALVTLARATRRYERAARFAARAAEASDDLDPDSALALAYRAWLHLDASRLARLSGDEAAAVRHYEIARGIAPDHGYVLCFEASLLLAEAADGSGLVAVDDPRASQAEALLSRAEAADPNLYELHWTRGEWARATGRLLAAEKSLRDAIAVDPGRPEAWIARVDLYLARSGMSETAEKFAREGLRQTDDPGLRFRLALALSVAGRIEEARQHYEAYLAVRPRDSEARAGLASVLAALGMRQLYQLQPDALERIAERILELDPLNPKPLVMKAVVARGRRELLEALVLLENARDLMPADPEVERLYAETLRDRGWQLRLQEDRPDASIDHFVRFLAVAPPDVPTDAVANLVLQEWRRQVELGRQALVGGDAAAAERGFRRAIELRPDDGRTAVDYFLGLALFQSTLDADPERLGEALACFERADAGRRREPDGDRGLAVLYRMRTLIRLGRLDDAIALGDEFLVDPGPTAEDVVQRIRAAIDR